MTSTRDDTAQRLQEHSDENAKCLTKGMAETETQGLRETAGGAGREALRQLQKYRGRLPQNFDGRAELEEYREERYACAGRQEERTEAD